MDKIELIERLAWKVRSETGDSPVALKAVDEFRRLCDMKKHLRAFDVLHELKASGNWSPTSESEELLEKFYWDVAY